MRRIFPFAAVALVVASVLIAGCAKGSGGAADKSQPAAAANPLQIADVVAGSGEAVKPDDYVSIDYTAWSYANGAKGGVQASTASHGAPQTLHVDAGANWPLGKLSEGILGMKVGGKRTFVIPPAERAPTAAPAKPDSSVMLEVSLLSIPHLQKQTLVAGNGAEAKPGDNLSVNYTGWLWENGAKGKKFDSSLDSGQPLQFQLGVGRVIPGWDAGVEGMRVGEKRQLIVPPELAYGKRGAGGGVIPPGATLLFEIELLKVEGK